MSFRGEDLYKNYFEKVYKTVYYIIKNEELAKDAAQETFIKAFKNLNALKEPSKIESWLITIATRTALDVYNKDKKRNVVEFVESKYPSKADRPYEDKEELEMHLNHIPPEQKQILVLKYMEDLSEKEIARRLKLKLGTVKSRLFRAKKKLLEEFQSRGGM